MVVDNIHPPVVQAIRAGKCHRDNTTSTRRSLGEGGFLIKIHLRSSFGVARERWKVHGCFCSRVKSHHALRSV